MTLEQASYLMTTLIGMLVYDALTWLSLRFSLALNICESLALYLFHHNELNRFDRFSVMMHRIGSETCMLAKYLLQCLTTEESRAKI